jgi:hypothetical protein
LGGFFLSRNGPHLKNPHKFLHLPNPDKPEMNIMA